MKFSYNLEQKSEKPIEIKFSGWLYVILICGIISLVTSLAVVIKFIKNSKNATYSSKIIVSLSIYNLIQGGIIIYSEIFALKQSTYDKFSPNLCIVQGFMRNYFDLSQQIFIFFLSYSIYRAVICQETFTYKQPIFFIVLTMLLTILGVCALPLIFGSYGPSMPGFQYSCQLKSWYNLSDSYKELLEQRGLKQKDYSVYVAILFRFILIIIPIPLIFSYQVYTAVKVRQNFQQWWSFDTEKQAFKTLVLLYPIAFLLSWAGTYILYFIETFKLGISNENSYQDTAWPYLYYIFRSLFALSGFFNSLIYGFNLTRLINKPQFSYKNYMGIKSGKISVMQSELLDSILEGNENYLIDYKKDKKTQTFNKNLFKTESSSNQTNTLQQNNNELYYSQLQTETLNEGSSQCVSQNNTNTTFLQQQKQQNQKRTIHF
ncbi:hypothetical protein PPERSA_01992 [Pseudocohnilembus persalinus]|uniref:G-protein coupled receptors family 1 profile domain-containing protein n=1 Tax=Pseudocohnilembus persalinus TaxID=266149 RepID=A0A0V0QF57_PSEPJ|nr:hypothetical protein PPERSA_01992 [Pseudocohnilembus persalinus]|eukprot:KRX00813.1 hypothetical protein PPERSA_01992 [Pseudocohnilembus persalinus]